VRIDRTPARTFESLTLPPPQKKLPEVRPRAGEHHGKPNPGHQSHPSGEQYDLFGHRSACIRPYLQRPNLPAVSRCGQLARNLRKLLPIAREGLECKRNEPSEESKGQLECPDFADLFLTRRTA
jgi:hypothetical protein